MAFTLERTLVPLFVVLLASHAYGQPQKGAIQTTYHWHLQQPIYWPDKLPDNPMQYQFAYQSIELAPSQGGHPEDNLNSIFSDPDRQAVYQYRAKNAIDSADTPDVGAQVSYPGDLIENVNSLAENGDYLSYYPNYNATYAAARQETTSGGFPKMDLVAFPYHHLLGPLVDANALRKSIEIHKVLYPQVWGTKPSSYSRGYFPAEMAFSERMIPVLVEQGIEWVIVSDNHISRCCSNYSFSPYGDQCDPPNPADQINPPQPNWFRMSISRGCTPNNAYPFSMRPHYAQYIDPFTGNSTSIIVVPAEQAIGWEDSCQCIGIDLITQLEAGNTDPAHPMLILMAHDGDNFFSGGYSYYMQCVPTFAQEAYANGINPTTVQQYLADYPVDLDDIVHVEDGAWVNAVPDFGSPSFLNWNWPLVNSTGQFDIPNGWGLDERNWAVITAAENRVETAEQLTPGGVRITEIQNPTADASPAEIAWHFHLPSMSSDYMYYGAVLDMPVKPTIACNNAVYWADQIVNVTLTKYPQADKTPPTVWKPQRLPWNPGGYGAGSLWGYKYVAMPTDFYIWTFVYDVSGLANVTFHYRIDSDGVNPLSDNVNEVFDPVGTLGLDGFVGPWMNITMNMRPFPAANIFNWSNIDFFVMPTYIADEYWVHIEGLSDVLIDYYISAVDTVGNVKVTDIYHVYIGSGPSDENPAKRAMRIA